MRDSYQLDVPLLAQDAFDTELDHRTASKERYDAVTRRGSLQALSFSACRFIQLATHRPLGVCCGRHVPRMGRVLITLLNLALSGILFFVVISVLNGLLFPSYASPPRHYKALEDGIQASTVPGRGNPHNEQIFIASNIIQADLIKDSWGPSLIELVELLGPENVFVSIYENDSGLPTQVALNELRNQLPCQHSIVTGDHLPLSSFPTVIPPNGEARVKRLTYLSEVRNRLLQPLDDPALHKEVMPGLQFNYTERHFDRILFLNDIYFKPVEALQLLFSTNRNPATLRANYDVACAADFVASVMFYDTFVVRDAEGYGMGLMFFPWFTNQGRGESRKDTLAEKDAVRVQSCWGGMVAFAAAPFLAQSGIKDGGGSSPLRFRHQEELYWEAAECCLINADVAARAGIRKAEPKIFLNPYIRVAYDAKSWSWLPFIRRIERVFVFLQRIVSAIGYPEYNPRRKEIPGQVSSQVRWVYDNPELNGERFRNQSAVVPVEGRQGKWEMVDEMTQPGGFCGQRRLFVMMPDLKNANENQKGRNWEKGVWPSKV